MEVKKNFEIVLTTKEVEVILKEYFRNNEIVMVDDIEFRIETIYDHGSDGYDEHGRMMVTSIICTGKLN